MPWIHRYTRLVAAASLLLITAGGLVTSTGSGLAVPDWPNTYGYFIFSFPLSQMVGGIFYEHGHRLIASTVGLSHHRAGGLAVASRRPAVGAPDRLDRAGRGHHAGNARRVDRALLPPAADLDQPRRVGADLLHAGRELGHLHLTRLAGTLRRAGGRQLAIEGDLILRRLAVVTPAIIYAQVLLARPCGTPVPGSPSPTSRSRSGGSCHPSGRRRSPSTSPTVSAPSSRRSSSSRPRATCSHTIGGAPSWRDRRASSSSSCSRR